MKVPLLLAVLLLAAACDDPRARPQFAEPLPPPAAATAPAPPRPAASPEAERSAAESEEAPTPPPVASARPTAIRVALFDAPGVVRSALDATVAILEPLPNVSPRVITPEDVRAGALDQADVVFFTGGRGSFQGRELGEDGRARVRAFVQRGGGYVGVCAGAYLALQGREEFFKLAIVAGRHMSGDAWHRGIKTVRIEDTRGEIHRVHYANGPIFEPVTVDSLPAYRSLARYRDDVYSRRHGTIAGEMPGTPAVIATRYGDGRVLLFSPNPALGGMDEPARPDMIVDAVAWVAEADPVPEELGYQDVFSSRPQ